MFSPFQKWKEGQRVPQQWAIRNMGVHLEHRFFLGHPRKKVLRRLCHLQICFRAQGIPTSSTSSDSSLPFQGFYHVTKERVTLGTGVATQPVKKTEISR